MISRCAKMANDKKPGQSSARDKDSGSKSKDLISKEDIEARVAKKLAKSEKERAEKAKKLAADFQRRSILAAAASRQDGGAPSSVGTPANETPSLLRNMCGILNKGFASLGADMKDLRTSFKGELNAFSNSMEANLQELWGGFEEEEEMDDVTSVGGSEREPAPPEPFRFGTDHDMSEEDSDEEDFGIGAAFNFELPVPGNVGPIIDQAPAELEDPAAPAENENFFARFARSLRVPTDVGTDLDPHLATLLNQIFE